ncbi:hypothetical protein BSQ50_10465 [Liquorilactobacillus nagelii]|uniref:Uncharacterized protein n=1 Tax=Liquorilactobacillus nagelii TaxID=82688 RepID=A0A3S6QY00_9LACO|nr:hypothetical protein BSQ50_10465 [Liquorilactobacillus nagelii]
MQNHQLKFLQADRKPTLLELRILSCQNILLTYPQQKSELKNQLHEVHQEISERTQKQLKAFAEENPKIKQPDPESNQSLKC